MRPELPETLCVAADATSAPGRYGVTHPAHDPEGWNVVFSGQILAQMIMVADAEVDSAHDVKSIQAIFSRTGNYDQSMSIETETTHAGRLFGSQTLTAYQGERLLSRGLVLMNADEPDLVRHEPTAPDAPGPDELDPDEKSLGFPTCETRTVVAPSAVAADGTPRLSFWLRYPGELESVAAQQAVLAWSTPGELIGLAMRPHADQMTIGDAHQTLSTGVIAHTIHFHARFDASKWLLVDLAATFTGRGRVYGEGRVFDCSGSLVATFSQDSMLRRQQPRQGKGPAL